MKIHRLSLMLCQLRFSDSLNKDYDENIHLPGLWLDTDGFKKERGLMLQVWQAADASDESGVWKVYKYVREGASGLRRRVALHS